MKIEVLKWRRKKYIKFRDDATVVPSIFPSLIYLFTLALSFFAFFLWKRKKRKRKIEKERKKKCKGRFMTIIIIITLLSSLMQFLYSHLEIKLRSKWIVNGKVKELKSKKKYFFVIKLLTTSFYSLCVSHTLSWFFFLYLYISTLKNRGMHTVVTSAFSEIIKDVSSYSNIQFSINVCIIKKIER